MLLRNDILLIRLIRVRVTRCGYFGFIPVRVEIFGIADSIDEVWTICDLMGLFHQTSPGIGTIGTKIHCWYLPSPGLS